nr:MAG TPA: hypothetical protein [Caudoviricetes sp.]
MFEQLKHDVEFILDEVYSGSEYYYRNWMYRIIHEKEDYFNKRKEIKAIFKKWHDAFKKITEDPKDRLDMINTMDKIIYKTSVLKFAKLITSPNTNKEIFDFLCLVYRCATAKDRAVEFFSNKMQNTIFTEEHDKLRKKFINYDRGVLVLDNLGIIEKALIVPHHFVSFPFYDQITTIVNRNWDNLPIVSGLVNKREFNKCRDYLSLGKMGNAKYFEVLDGEVRVDVSVESGEDLTHCLHMHFANNEEKYILRPIYLVEGQGLVSDPNLVKLDRLKRIAGFDLCEKPKDL